MQSQDKQIISILFYIIKGSVNLPHMQDFIFS